MNHDRTQVASAEDREAGLRSRLADAYLRPGYRSVVNFPPSKGGFTMTAIRKRFDEPDETREFSNGFVAGVALVGTRVAKATFQPGWRWSESVKPIVGGNHCQQHHVGYAIAGALHVVTDDGEEVDIAAGDAYEIEPGHDAWVEGDAVFEGLEFDPRTVETYAKPT